MWQLIWKFLSPSTCVLCQSGGDWICEECQKGNRWDSRRLGNVPVSGSRFDPGLIQATSLWKDGGCRELTQPFAKLIAARVGQSPATVIAVPPNPGALKRRGWWPTGELARAVASEIGRPFQANAVSIQQVPRDQRGLSDNERWSNVSSAFRLNAQLSDVLLVEDVITSGATVRAVLRSITESGGHCAEVSCVVFARSRFGFVQEV